MGGVRRIGWFFSLVALGVVTQGCTRVFKGNTTQPNPLVHPTETLRDSEKITIVTGDMELNMPEPAHDYGGSLMINRRYPLMNTASFTVVSRDRLRFHVQIEHKWREYADLHTWKAWIVDDKGHRYVPEAVEAGAAHHVCYMWDYETRSVRRNEFGDITAIYNDGYKRRKPLGALSVFRGVGDFVFYKRDLFTPDVKRLTLVVSRGGVAFTFTWKFTDDAPTGIPVGGSRAPLASR